jgi:GT2 family glycosyltransferase
LRRPPLSVVIIARNEGRELQRTVDNLWPRIPASSQIHIVDDGGRRPLGVAAARNHGARQTTGDVLLFADAHIRVPDDFWPPLEHVLQRPGIGAVAPAIANLRDPLKPPGYGLTFTGPDLEVKWLAKQSCKPFDVPIVPGCCLAMTRDAFNATGGWDGALLQRGGVDNEFSIRHWLLGYRLQIVPQVEVMHLFRTRSPFHVGWPQYLHNRLRLAIAHLSPARLAKVIGALSRREELDEALQLAAKGGAWTRRDELFTRRTKNDHWYFRKFGLEW